ncbi:MAG: DUF4118 domain-containing protein [Clostridiales bacterium]|nr:DUF4118 domain-containing protein [Candidatus Crickella equi]
MNNSTNKYKFNWDSAFVNFIFTLGILILATIICAVIHQQNHNGSTPALMIFILAILVIARMTNGYIWGIGASFIGVVVVNFIFTYPYMKLNFFLEGYPITFITMLVVSIITSTTSTQIKLHQKLKIESEHEEVRANLLRAISHDIRTPLTSIIGSTSVLLNEDCQLSEEHKRQLLQDVQDDGQWLIRVTENILSITRIDGNNQLVKTDELAEELFETAIRKFNKRHPDSVPIEVNLPDQPLIVPMDMILIEQVLLNLMENALIHGTGLSKIVLSLESRDNMAVFSVMDNGACMPDYMFPTLFEGRLKSDKIINKGNKRCMGIGLAVCRTIIDAHDGTITAYNLEDREGVVFSFALPVKEMESNDEN